MKHRKRPQNQDLENPQEEQKARRLENTKKKLKRKGLTKSHDGKDQNPEI